jgi:hypothetical protein
MIPGSQFIQAGTKDNGMSVLTVIPILQIIPYLTAKPAIVLFTEVIIIQMLSVIAVIPGELPDQNE